MQIKIIDQLKTGSIKNILPFGSGEQQQPPYVVVKKETELNGIRYRIIPHFQINQQIFLEDYTFGEVPNLLNDFSAISRHGNNNQLELLEKSDIIINNSDGTISAEISFLAPCVNISNL